jgi:hypothetical protein
MKAGTQRSGATGFSAFDFLISHLALSKKSVTLVRIPSGVTGQIEFRVRQQFKSRRKTDWLTFTLQTASPSEDLPKDMKSGVLPERERLRMSCGKSSALGIEVLSHRIGTREVNHILNASLLS